MKKLCLTFLLLIIGLLLQAQNISVKDFYYAENDLTARTYGTSVEDQNGNLCALIKVRTIEKGLWAFDVGMLGVTKTEMQNAAHPAEIWVYVPFSVTRMTIQHEQLGLLDRWPFPCSIEKGCTYIMELTTGKVTTIVEEAVNQQYLAFQITPANAVLEVNGKIWEVDAEGNAQEYVSFGTYEYRVQAPDYHPAVGKVTVNDPENTAFQSVTLNPNFGWIEVGGRGDLQGASVYIDNALIGKAPCKSDALKSGQHTVRIAKKMYDTYSVTVTVNDNETTPVNPVLEANFANVTLKVDADAEIWVNNERKGVRTWTGALGYGSYKVECKQANHETSLTTLEVTAAMNGETLPLPAPTPIYGSLNVESSPKFCQLYIDGKDMGTTPKSVNQILIGQHEIWLTKEGYAEHKETVTITKGERKQVNATLTPANVTYVEGNQKTSGEVTSGNYKGHEWVDLGLPSGTLWATCNVGADTPEDYGDYFAWGETMTKSSYGWSNYKNCNGSYDRLTKYCNKSSYGNNGFTDNLTLLQACDDAATANWGSGWCMPTNSQWEELKNNTTVTWTTQNGVKGRKFTASNGKSLFLPAAGYRNGSKLHFAGSRGYYWSSSIYTGHPDVAWLLRFLSDNVYMILNDDRKYGQSVRAVRSESQN